ncbi:MAG: hypothetical protein PHO02_02265 [Candidatus Nanoarchaeia archaeon]|nr:hypothetical protein [Candidatus Nanoarchaeia archaeon]
MKKKKSLLTKRLYFAIAVLTLLVAAGIMTSAFTLVPPGMPTHANLYTSKIYEMGDGGIEVIGSDFIASQINGTTSNSGKSAVVGKNTATGVEGRLGYSGYGVYTPNALYAGSVSTGSLSASSISTSSLSMSGALSAQSFTSTGGASTGVYGKGTTYGARAEGGTYGLYATGTSYGVYTPNTLYAGAYTGGYFYGSGISTSGSASAAGGFCTGGYSCSSGWYQGTGISVGQVSASGVVSGNTGIFEGITLQSGVVSANGYKAGGQPGTNDCFFAFGDGGTAYKVCTSGGIVTQQATTSGPGVSGCIGTSPQRVCFTNGIITSVT